MIGEAGLTTALHEAGYTLTERDPDYVVLGETRTYSFERITHAIRLIDAGARFIATNPDATGPSPDGPLPATGSVAALISRATGVEPYFVGKPNPLMMRSALNAIDAHSETTAMIGDRMDTDVVSGLEAGLETILVLTGVTTREEAERFPYRAVARGRRRSPTSSTSSAEPHAISVMVVQAGAGQRIAAVDPELTGETFQAIAGAARQAERDMTQLVALLAADDAIAQAPDLTLVEELVARAAGSGLDVTLRLEGSREGLPASAVQTVYRVVRESLTNALRYASGAPVRVLVRGGAGAIEVEVVNDVRRDAEALAGHGTGNGLRGLRERVGAGGGRLEAGPRGERRLARRGADPLRRGRRGGRRG